MLRAPGAETREMRFIDAVSDGLGLAMERHPHLVLMGQDIGDYGGVFKVTDGFVDRFGHGRVRNTDLAHPVLFVKAIVHIGHKSLHCTTFSAWAVAQEDAVDVEAGTWLAKPTWPRTTGNGKLCWRPHRANNHCRCGGN